MSDNLEIPKPLFKPRVPSPFGQRSPTRDSTMSNMSSTNPDLGKTCFYCQQYMYPKEIGYGPIKGNYYHDGCFKCAICDVKLDLRSYNTNGNDLKDKQVYCKRHAQSPSCSAAPYKPRVHAKNAENGSLTNHSDVDVIVTPFNHHETTDTTVSSEDSTFTAKYGWNVQYKDLHSYVDINNPDSGKINCIPQLPNADKLPNVLVFDNDKFDEKKNQPLPDNITPIAFELSKKLDSLDDENKEDSDKEDDLAKDVHKTHISDIITKEDDEKTNKIIDAILHKLDESEDEDFSNILPKIEPPQQPKVNESTVIGTIVATIIEKEKFNEGGNQTSNITINKDLPPSPPKPLTPEPELPKVIIPQIIDKTPEPDKPKIIIPQIIDKTPEPELPKVVTPQIIDKTPEKKPNSDAIIASTIINSVEKTTPTSSRIDKSPSRDSIASTSGVHGLIRTIGTPKAPRESAVSTDMPIVIDPEPAKRISKDVNNNTRSDIEGADKGLGILKLTIYYDDLVSELSIGVESAKNLINTDKKSLSDPYARVWLLPDPKEATKRKTKVIKDNLNPSWYDTFTYTMTFAEAKSKTIKVNLKDEKGFFQKQATQFLGDVFVPLNKLEKNKPISKWYYLQPKSDN